MLRGFFRWRLKHSELRRKLVRSRHSTLCRTVPGSSAVPFSPQRRRVPSPNAHVRTPRHPRIASRSAEPVLFNDIDRWVLRWALVQHGQAPRLYWIQATSTSACIRRVAGCATPTGSANRAGATASAGANQPGQRRHPLREARHTPAALACLAFRAAAEASLSRTIEHMRFENQGVSP
jgi:hypothetical protein